MGRENKATTRTENRRGEGVAGDRARESAHVGGWGAEKLREQQAGNGRGMGRPESIGAVLLKSRTASPRRKQGSLPCLELKLLSLSGRGMSEVRNVTQKSKR